VSYARPSARSIRPTRDAPRSAPQLLTLHEAADRPAVQFAYLTGWRMASEVLPLEWRNVDFEAGEVRLDMSKNGEGRVFPVTDDLRALLLAQQTARDRLNKIGHVVPWVF
jgi:integrase